MPRLYYVDSNETIAEITEAQLQFLIDNLEEEHSQDKDYYISRDTLEMLKENGCDAELYSLLEKAVGDDANGDQEGAEEREGVDIAWE